MPKQTKVKRVKGITREHWNWINEVVDNHKMIRSESTRTRVKILMEAAMFKVLELPTTKRK